MPEPQTPREKEEKKLRIADELVENLALRLNPKNDVDLKLMQTARMYLEGCITAPIDWNELLSEKAL